METLSAYYRVPVCMIMRANAFDNPQDIISCKEVKIPKKCYCHRCMDTHKAALQYDTYIVQPEDSLYSIARQHGITMNVIMKTNGLADAGQIRPGDPLSIPVLPGTPYCVRAGETLEDIARSHHTTVKAIRDMNCLSADEKIYPGMRLIL